MKTNAIIRIIILSMVILILLGILFAGLGIGSLIARWTSDVITSDETTITGGTASVSPDQVRNLNIEWVSGSITIQPGDTNVILIRESGNFPEDDHMVWHQSGNTLTIQFSKAKISVGIEFNFSKDLVITVPRDWQCEDLDITSVSAKIEVFDLTAEEIEALAMRWDAFRRSAWPGEQEETERGVNPNFDERRFMRREESQR